MPPEVAGFWFGVAIAVGAVGVVSMGYLFNRIGGKRATITSGLTSAALTFFFFFSPLQVRLYVNQNSRSSFNLGA